MFLLRCLLVLFVSMLPVIELRGAVPIGVGLGLPEILTLVIAIIGNILPIPFIYKFSRRILEWGSGQSISNNTYHDQNTANNQSKITEKPRKIWKPFQKVCKFILKKGEKAGKKLMKRTGDGIFIGLFFFVGIPIPGTGVWTGTLAASMLDLDYKKTIKAIICGVLLSGCIMLAISLGIFKLIFGN